MWRRLLFLVMAAAGVAAGQDPPTSIGRLNYISGSVSFQPGGVNDWVPAAINRPLTVGDQLYADSGARAEVHIPGTAFRLGSQTAFQFLNLDDRNAQVRLPEGTLDVRVRRLNENLEVDTPNLAFTFASPGEYRIDTNPDTYETYVTVRSGEGQVTGNAGTFSVHGGEQAVITGQDGSQFNLYQAPQYDEFDNWVQSRNRREDRGLSARYVSPDIVGYEDLDDYGYWRNVPEYGRCWVPRDVPAGWAPYHEGHWAWVDPWGWTWVDDEPWGFAPFHYGRWAYFNGFWGWVPGPVAVAPVYAPALVAWVGFGGGGFGASFGLGGGPAVGWFPLSPRDVYIPAYNASQTYVSRVNVTNTTVINTTNITNVYNNYIQTKTISTANYTNRTVPGAVVAVPQSALASARPVQQVSIKVQPNQISALKTVDPAPHVVPQAASVLGRTAPASAAARPPTAVLSRPVVAKSTPPPAPSSFQQRQSLLAQNPGHPLPIQEQQQIARTAPAATRPQVKVVAQARPVTPPMSKAPAAPRPAPGAPALTQRPSATPPPAQNQSAPPRSAQPQQRPQTQMQQQTRPYEPPSVQQRPTVPPQTRPAPQASRPYEPPRDRERQAPAAPPKQPTTAPPQQQRNVEPQAPEQGRNRTAPQPKPQYQPPPQREQARPAPAPPRPQARPAPPPPQPRQVEPQPPDQGRNRTAPAPQHQPSPQREQARPAPAPPRPEARPAPPPRQNPPKDQKKDDQKKAEE